MARVRLYNLKLRPPRAPRYRNSRTLDAFIAHCTLKNTTIGTRECIIANTLSAAARSNAILAVHNSGENRANITTKLPNGRAPWTDGYVVMTVIGNWNKGKFKDTDNSVSPNPALSVEYGRSSQHFGRTSAIAPLRRGVFGKAV